MAGNKYKDGYLLKTVNMRILVRPSAFCTSYYVQDVNNVVPSLEELQRFQDKPVERGEEEAKELAGLASSLKQRRKVNFVKGDTVTVIEGDLKHLMGVVESTDNDTVTIMPKHEELHVRWNALDDILLGFAQVSFVASSKVLQAWRPCESHWRSL